MNRIVGANGSYTISGEVSNPTANSFYIPDSELVDNQVVEFSTATGGVVPTSVSGALTPDKNAIETVYSATKTALDANVSTMGSDHARLWYNYRDGTAYHWYPFRHNSTDYDGGEQYFYMYRNRIQI